MRTQAPLTWNNGGSYCTCPLPIDHGLDIPEAAITWNSDAGACQCPELSSTPGDTEVAIIWNPTIKICTCPMPASYGPTEVALVFSTGTVSCTCPPPVVSLTDDQLALILSVA